MTHFTTQLEEERTFRQKCKVAKMFPGDDRARSFNNNFLNAGEEKVNEMKVHKENMERVSKMVAEEVQALRAQCDRERENAKIMKIEAERVRSIFNWTL